MADNLLDDLMIVLLAYIAFYTPSLVEIAGITALHFSVWIVYEAGYVENDRVAASIEVEGSVPPRFAEYSAAYRESLAWLWAALMGALGVFLILQGPDSRLIFDRTMGYVYGVFAWLMLLLLLRASYWIYNNIDKMTRTYVYPVLQVFKYAFPSLFLSLGPFGAALIFSQILRRWIPYVVYRFAGIKKHNVPTRLFRLVAFAILAVLMSDLGKSTAQNWNLLIILGWLVLRSANEGRRVFAASSWVAKDGWRRAENRN